MHIQVLLWNGMRTENDLNVISIFKKLLKSVNVWTGRVTHQKAGCEMNDLHPIPDHFIARILDIAAWTAVTGCIPNQLNIFILITAKGTLTFPHRTQAFSARTGSVTVTNDDPDFCFLSLNNNFSGKGEVVF
jgi:hypothetical protein